MLPFFFFLFLFLFLYFYQPIKNFTNCISNMSLFILNHPTIQRFTNRNNVLGCPSQRLLLLLMMMIRRRCHPRLAAPVESILEAIHPSIHLRSFQRAVVAAVRRHHQTILFSRPRVKLPADDDGEENDDDDLHGHQPGWCSRREGRECERMMKTRPDRG